MTSRPFRSSRVGQAARVSAAYAAAVDRMQDALEAAGWDVTRLVTGADVTIVLERPSGIPGLVEESRYAGPTALDAMRLAVSDHLQQAVDG